MLINNISLFNKYIVFNPWLMLIDIGMIFHFIIYWIKHNKTYNHKIDYWRITLTISFFVPVLLLYPFNASIYNSTGEATMKLIHPFIDIAFLITIIGYIFVWVGGWYREIRVPKNVPVIASNIIEELICKVVKSKKLVTFFILLILMLIVFIIIMQVKYEYVFNPRLLFSHLPHLRPIYNITNVLYPMGIIISGLYAMHYKNFFYRALFINLLILSFFLGTKGAILSPILILILFYYMLNPQNINILKLFMWAGVFFISIIVLDILRNGNEFQLSAFTNLFFKLAYGDTFSDTRDFAWVMAYWDHNFLLGKTYLAGLMGFIPRSISEFRNEWGLGIFTASTVGFDTISHPGLRPGLFGEPYFNFGLLGVIFVGFWFGYITKHVDLRIKESISKKDLFQSYSRTFPRLLAGSLCLSLGFSSIYTFLGIILFLALILEVKTYLISKLQM